MTLKEALQVVLEDESIEDFIYTVRDRASADGDWKGSRWEHPRVKRFSQALAVLCEELRRA